MEASVVFGRLALTNSPIPTSAAGSRDRRADGDKYVRRDVIPARRLRRTRLAPSALRKFRQLRAEAGELALLKPEFFGDRSRGVAGHQAPPALPVCRGGWRRHQYTGRDVRRPDANG